jgi:protein O-mannosyl-transferase
VDARRDSRRASGRREPVPPAASRITAFTTFAVLTFAVIAVYARAIDAPFIFDDVPAVVENDSITRLWPLVGDEVRRGPLNPDTNLTMGRRPLANLSLAVDYALHGLDPVGYRVVNLLLYGLAAVVVAAIVRRTLRLDRFAGAFDRNAEALALVVALVWTVHPLNTETVVSVNLRTELLAGLLYLTAMWAALRHWTAPPAERIRWVVVAACAAIAGAGAKQNGVTLPFVMLLFEWTFFGRTPMEALRRSPLLYAGVTASWLLLVFLNVGNVENLQDTRYDVPAWVWYVTQAKVFFLYLKLTVWPWPLAIHYAPEYLRTLGAAVPWLLALAAIGIAVAIALWQRRVVGFVGTVVPVLLMPTAIVPLIKMMASERRMYLPLVPLVALLVVGTYRVARTRGVGGRALAAAGGVAVALLAIVSVVRLGAYESTLSIWEDNALRQPTDAMAHYNLGNELVALGRDEEALPRYRRAIELEPNHTWARENLAGALGRLGRAPEAEAELRRALEIDPGSAVAHNDLGSLLTAMGRPADAIAHLDQALALEPTQPKGRVHLNLGTALLRTGRVDEALGHLERAVQLEPNDAGARAAFGTALLSVGRPADAVMQLEAATRLAPGDGPAHGNLGVALAALGRTGEAVAQLEAAVRLQPESVGARYNLANALLDAGRPREALPHLETAIRLAPDDAQVRLECATAYAAVGDTGRAVAMAEQAGTIARSRGDTALAAEVDAWLQRHRTAPPG